MKRSRYDRKNRSFLKVFAFGTVCNLVLFFAFTFAASLIISGTKDPLSFIGVAAFAVMALTGAFSGFITAKFKGENGAFPAALCSFILAFILLGAGLILGGGRVSLISPINLFSYFAFAIIFAHLTRKRHRYRRR